ncbi:hypothetical protein B0J11DRAFT_568442 [Dendryphion nanum]|uniref:Uncharacterized protein n=1 Tax=Dendryphion nanum TaxID=256645 RepID=A0A9P9IKK9_9PLEO|nr:hypothetical protein B0J11DRAFT_568442 [Dendryphion nanum]
MASKLCCIVEDDSRSGSPDLPNARSSAAVTPAKRPLLPKQTSSPGSRDTSFRSQDLHELHEIFRNVKSSDSKPTPPTEMPRSRFARSNIYNLHKIRSVHALIRRRLSKDLSKPADTPISKSVATEDRFTNDGPDTVVKFPRAGPNLQLKITKDDLRKDLLSDKRPADGGYDPDAEVLDDVARKVGKQASKRPSLHSIDWASSPESKDGSPIAGKSSDFTSTTKPYHVDSVQSADKPSAIGLRNQYSSSPNLRLGKTSNKDRKLRRSYSATSIVIQPGSSPFLHIRLPSFDSKNHEDVPWSVSTYESLHLPHVATTPSLLNKKPETWSLRTSTILDEQIPAKPGQEAKISSVMSVEVMKPVGLNPCSPAIHVQEPTMSPRASRSLNKSQSGPDATSFKESHRAEEGDNPRRSVHLYSMRISHHLRSGSLLSWDTQSVSPALPDTSRLLRQRTLSNNTHVTQLDGPSRHKRQNSSSGFASSKVPSKWGKVVPAGHEKAEISSIYSSRPHSPPDSFGGSLANLSLPTSNYETAKSADLSMLKNAASDVTDDEETPRPPKRHVMTFPRIGKDGPVKEKLLANRSTIPRNNSVATTKKSKFREEFSPTAPRKKSTPSISLMKILRNRTSVRSQSDTNLKARAGPQVDGPIDAPSSAPNRQRRLSQTLLSLKVEQESPGSEREANPMWERALKAYQDERSSMFLPKSDKLAIPPPLFRERSSSTSRRRASAAADISPTQTRPDLHESTKAVTLSDATPDLDLAFQSRPLTRRTALVGTDKNELQAAFDKQMDDQSTVGAWGRYPSHTRQERTTSAGHLDSVRTRDFGLEAAIQFAKGEDSIDPTVRPKSPELGDKKRKKRIGTARISKSNSMTFGKQFLKNYTRIFRSQSTEFQRHGHGHRSSVTAGGILDYPELEIVPDVWRRGVINERSGESSSEEQDIPQSHKKCKGELKPDDSMATLRPQKGTKVTSDTIGSPTILDCSTDQSRSTDRARVWSVFYEDCLPSFPQPSNDAGSHSRPNLENILCLNEFRSLPGRTNGRHSFDLKPTAMRPSEIPSKVGHSRHGSRASVMTKASIVPSFCSDSGLEAIGDGDENEEGRSMVSVRKSTMDLVTLSKEQEVVERERVLNLMRVESVRMDGLLKKSS